MPDILKEEDLDLVNDQIVNIKDFEKSRTEEETYESIEESTYPQDD